MWHFGIWLNGSGGIQSKDVVDDLGGLFRFDDSEMRLNKEPLLSY